MLWYGDNSELKGIWDAPIPDILLFGGIAIGKEQVEALKKIILDFKRRYRPEADFPIKWNFRDLEKWYRNNNLTELYSKLLSDSKSWRTDLIKAASAIDYKVIASCVNFHSNKVEKIKANKLNVVKYTFCNSLMRVAMYAKEINSQHFEVVLDWPESSSYSPYCEEYRDAYLNGRCHASPEITYFSGPLKLLNFDETLYFTRMEECSLLQFSDLILGTTREFIDYSLGKKTIDSLGVELTKHLTPKYRGFPQRIIGRGISVAPTGSELSEQLLKGMLKLRGL